MRAADVGHPIADGLVDRVLERAAAAVHRADFGAQQAHAQHVGLLAGNIHRAHVDDALQPEQRRGGGGGHAVLPGAGLGDDAALAHAFGQQRLAERVVDLVRAGVGQVLALQVNLRAAQLLGQTAGIGQRGGPAHVGMQQVSQLSLKYRVGLHAAVGCFQLGQRGHERFGHKLPAVRAELGRIRAAFWRACGRWIRSFMQSPLCSRAPPG